MKKEMKELLFNIIVGSLVLAFSLFGWQLLLPIYAAAVDEAEVSAMPDGWKKIYWEGIANGSGVANAETTNPVRGMIQRGYLLPTTSGATANTFTITVKEMALNATDTVDITSGAITHDAENLKAIEFWPTTAIPVASDLRFDLSGVSNTTSIGSAFKLQLYVSPPAGN